MRLILDGNDCSNPRAPTPAFFSPLALFLSIHWISQSISYFLHLYCCTSASLLHFLPSFFIFNDVYSCFLPSSWIHNYLISNAPSIFFVCLLWLFYSLLSYSFRLLPPSLYHPLYFLSSFPPFPFLIIFHLYSPFLFLFLYPSSALSTSSTLHPLFTSSLSPHICPLLPSLRSVHSSRHLLPVMGLSVLNTRWRSSAGQTAAALWWQHGATKLNRADKNHPAATHEYGMDCIRHLLHPSHTRQSYAHTLAVLLRNNEQPM